MMNYPKLCSLVLGLEPSIRGVFAYHYNGELLGGGMRDGTESYLPSDEMAKSIHNTILRWKTRESLYPFLGLGKYSITKYEKVKRITLPLDDHTILVVGMEVEVDHDIIIDKIFRLIN